MPFANPDRRQQFQADYQRGRRDGRWDRVKDTNPTRDYLCGYRYGQREAERARAAERRDRPPTIADLFAEDAERRAAAQAAPHPSST